MKIDEEFVINKYADNESTYSIAKELGTYPKKIERILKKNNIKLRSKSESQKLALKAGRCEHPTKGKKRTEEEKVNISEGVYNNWQNKTKEERKEISRKAKQRWIATRRSPSPSSSNIGAIRATSAVTTASAIFVFPPPGAPTTSSVASRPVLATASNIGEATAAAATPTATSSPATSSPQKTRSNAKL